MYLKYRKYDIDSKYQYVTDEWFNFYASSNNIALIIFKCITFYMYL